jgi:hypothetical protein
MHILLSMLGFEGTTAVLDMLKFLMLRERSAFFLETLKKLQIDVRPVLVYTLFNRKKFVDEIRRTAKKGAIYVNEESKSQQLNESV